MTARLTNIIGTKHNRLKILEEAAPILNSGIYRRAVYCECECGNNGVYRLFSILNDNTKSCGCLRDEKSAERNKSTKGKVRSKYVKVKFSYWDHISDIRANNKLGRI